MARQLKCPDDTAPMQPLFLAPAKGGMQVEIDRCIKCGALWFDAGELEVLSGLDSRDTHAESPRACPVCADPMADAMLARETLGQRCDRCHGTYVDGKQMKRLHALSLPSLVKTDENPAVAKPQRRTKPVAQKGPVPATPDAPRRTTTAGFVCAKCGKTFPFAEGNGTNKGLVCRGCVINPTIDRKRRGGLLAGATDVNDDDAFLGDWDVSDLF